MTLYDETIARFTDRVAALLDAPDRSKAEWFYADLSRLAAAAIDDVVALELAEHREVQAESAYLQGHDDGYRRGLKDARAQQARPVHTGRRDEVSPRRTPPAPVPHRPADRDDAHRVTRRSRADRGGGGRGGIA